MSGIAEIAATAAVVLASTVLTLSILGLVRIPDTYVKVHTIAKAVAIGPLLVLVATLPSGDAGLILRAILVGGLLLLTAAVAAHAIVALEKHGQNDERGEDRPPD